MMNNLRIFRSYPQVSRSGLRSKYNILYFIIGRRIFSYFISGAYLISSANSVIGRRFFSYDSSTNSYSQIINNKGYSIIEIKGKNEKGKEITLSKKKEFDPILTARHVRTLFQRDGMDLIWIVSLQKWYLYEKGTNIWKPLH
jgi:hypothetical protein